MLKSLSILLAEVKDQRVIQDALEHLVEENTKLKQEISEASHAAMFFKEQFESATGVEVQ